MISQGNKTLLRFFRPGRSLLFYVSLILVLVLSFLGAHYSESGYRSYMVEFVVETEETVNFAIYYDVGRGYNEVDHQSIEIGELGAPTTISFCIPVWTELEKIRFDPAKKHVEMTLHSIKILYDEDSFFQVPLDTLDPQNHIVKHDFDGEKYTFETDPEGDDPIFVLNKIRDKQIVSSRKEPLRYLLWSLAGLSLLFFARFVHRYFFLGV